MSDERTPATRTRRRRAACAAVLAAALLGGAASGAAALGPGGEVVAAPQEAPGDHAGGEAGRAVAGVVPGTGEFPRRLSDAGAHEVFVLLVGLGVLGTGAAVLTGRQRYGTTGRARRGTPGRPRAVAPGDDALSG